MGKLDGKVAIITGGARGMGAAHARRFVEEGASVVIADVLTDLGAKLADDLGERAMFAELDVRDRERWTDIVTQTVQRFGRLDVLVNNAGIFRRESIETHSHEMWDEVIGVNLTGIWNGTKAVIPALKAAGGGSIINVSSTAGMTGYAWLPAYTTSKWGIRGLTKTSALDLGQYGIRVNSVHPGFVRTPMTEELGDNTANVALHRTAADTELTPLVLFLASDDSAFSTGAEFIADGGESAGLPVHN
ncbi:3-alpha-hydroxysteroid dehydrogenase [Actinoplanes cyaneus]|uniref:3-alpha-hydroxysteroid dehydrogenase n=1 Tax=Actinoplanes cyaneus TaxID=52696 RepID=A0A919ITJ8_9ACTN|nr:SDR family NAD(P)-dependent oxidoreductase [Actinoplanes cyaneus]MCW2144075.1 3alpha(or 20beta)-hydroxysteroid dehydrogenase [Actinoplanes cyaneus]GID70766.1 3-alpha-hydroxysteroid dehydrogenase [Actinoplanes cyaneus]